MDHLDKDRRMLHALGYAQELRRGMSGFSNFAISFTIISILSGTLTLYDKIASLGPGTVGRHVPLVEHRLQLVASQ